MEGVGQDIDIGVYDMKANKLVSSSLKSSSGGGILYTSSDGTISSLNDVLSYDGSSNKIDLQSSRMFDVSKGVFLLSQSQKASIVEGVGQDIDIGVYDMKASKLVSSLKSSSGGGILYTSSDGTISSMNDVLSYDGSSNKIDLQSSRMFDVSKGVFLLSQSQKASIVEGVGQDIDIGVYDMKASKLVSSSLKSSSGGGILYTSSDGTISSMNDVLSYDGSSNKIDLQSSRMFDVSKGVFLLSQSQKASIVEGVGQDIDIGVYDMKASKLVSSSLKSSSGGGILYTSSDGTISSMNDVLSYDGSSNKIDLQSSRMFDVSKGVFLLN